MLHDPSRERPSDPIHAILWDAAGYIEEHGWCQHDLMSGERVCAIGAISEVAKVAAAGEVGGGPSVTEPVWDVMVDALRVFSAHIGTNLIPTWNDTSNRTQEEVVLALRGAAHSVKI